MSDSYGDAEMENARREAGLRAEAEQRRFAKFVMGGNAGGTVAALSLVGAILGTSGSHGPIPAAVFIMLVMFILGLAASWFSISIDARQADLLYRLNAGTLQMGEIGPARESIDNRRVWNKRAIRVAAILLITGSLIGLFQLALLTDWHISILDAAS